jgi:hypothetical protein
VVDIAMCNRKDCKKRLTCFRYLADSDEFGQTYLVVDKTILDNGCDNYWKCSSPKELFVMNRMNK